MEVIKKLEDALAGIFKSAPKMSESSRESLAKAWPIIALVFGVLNLFLAWGLWGITRTVDRLTEGLVGDYYQKVAGVNVGLSSTDKMLIYVGILLLAVDGVLLLMAFQPLQKRLRRGWDLVFLGAVLNLGYAVLSLFLYGRGVGSFISSLIGSALSFYLLFQVRDKFNGTSSVKKPSAPNDGPSKV